MAKIWVQWFGDSEAAIRSLSAVISLLAFPCIYWLCLELFNSSLMGWVAVALVAVSPFHVLYAQEAREYSLWIVTILLSSATLLRAMRLETKLSWGMYASTVVFGLYVYPGTALVTIGHGIYVIAIESFRLSKRVVSYLLALSVGLLAFTPWIWVMINQSDQINRTALSLSRKVPWLIILKSLSVSLSYFFIDFDYDFRRGTTGSVLKHAIPYLIPFVLALAGYAIYFLCRNTPKQVWLFVVILWGATALPLIIPALIMGARWITPRYLIPCYLSIQLAVTYLLATQVTQFSASTWRKKFWQLVTVSLLSGGVLSCAVSSQAETWWSKHISYYIPQMADTINQANHPFLIGSCSGPWPVGNKIALSRLLEPKVRMKFVREPDVPQIPAGYSDLFLFDAFSKPLGSQLEKKQNYKLETIDPAAINSRFVQLWKLVKQ